MVFLSPITTTSKETPSTLATATASGSTAEPAPSTGISTAELINQIQNGEYYSSGTGTSGAESIPGVTPNISSTGSTPTIIGGASIAPNTTPTTITSTPTAPKPIQAIQNAGSAVLVDKPVIPQDAQSLPNQEGANLAYLSPSGAIYYYYSPSFATKTLANNPFANGSRYSLDENSNLVSELYQIPSVNFNKIQASTPTAATNPLELDYAAFGEDIAPNITFSTPTSFTATYNNNGVSYNVLGNIPATQSLGEQEALNAAVDESYQAIERLGKLEDGTLVDINLNTGKASITSPNSSSTQTINENQNLINEINSGQYYSPYTGPRPISLTAPSGPAGGEGELLASQQTPILQSLDLTQSYSAPTYTPSEAAPQTISAAGPYVPGVGGSQYYFQPLTYKSSNLYNNPLAALQYTLSHEVTSGVQNLGRAVALAGTGIENKLGLTKALQTYNTGVVQPVEKAYTYNTTNPYFQFTGGLGQSLVGGIAALPEAPFALIANPVGASYNFITNTASEFANPTPSNLGKGLGTLALTGVGLKGGSLLSEEATGKPVDIATVQNVLGNEEPIVVRAAGNAEALSPKEIDAMRNQGLSLTKVSREIYPNKVAKFLGKTQTQDYYIGNPYEEFSAEKTPTITPQEAAQRDIFQFKRGKFVKVGKVKVNPTVSLTNPLTPIQLNPVTPITKLGQALGGINVAPDITTRLAPEETPLSTSTVYEMPTFNAETGLRELELGQPLAQSIQESETAPLPLYRRGPLYHTSENEYIPLTLTKGTLADIEAGKPLANFKILRFGRPVLNGVVRSSESPIREVYAAFEAAKPGVGNPLAPIGGVPRGLLTFSSAFSPNYGLSAIPTGLPTGEAFTSAIPLSSPNYGLNSPIGLAPAPEGGAQAANGGVITTENGDQLLVYKTATPTAERQVQEPLATVEENIPAQGTPFRYYEGGSLINKPLQEYNVRFLPETNFKKGQRYSQISHPKNIFKSKERSGSSELNKVRNNFKNGFVPVTPYGLGNKTEFIPITTQTTTRKQISEQPTSTSTSTAPPPGETPSPSIPIPLLKLQGGAGGNGNNNKELRSIGYGVYSPDVDVLLFPQLNQFGIKSTSSPLLGLGIRPEPQYLQSPTSKINIAYA